MRLVPYAALLAFSFPYTAPGEEPDIDRDARIQADVDKAKADVAKKYGDRPVKDLSSEERRERAREESEATNKALEKNGVDAKSYTVERAKMNKGQQQELSDKVQQVKKQDEDAAKKKAEAPQKIVVEKGLPPGEEGVPGEKGKSGGKKKKHKKSDE